MIYYNSNKIIKAYKGTSIVNEINDYLSGSEPTPRLPQGYTEVEWVGSTSSKNSSFDTLIAVGEVTGNTFSIEGKMWTVQQSGFAYLISNEWVSTPYPNFTWRWNNNTLNFDTPDGIEPDVELSLSDMGDGLSGFTISSDGLTLRNPKSVSFFCGNSNTADNTSFTPWRQGYGKLYGDTKITKNGVLVSNLIPCKRDSDSRYGFYCSVRETFLTGTNLVGGDEVVPSGTTEETKAVFQYITDGSEPTPPEPTDYSREYLTFVAEADNMSVGLTNAGNNVFQYSTDSGSTWSNLANDQSTTSVNSGQTIMFKATGVTAQTNYGIGIFKPSASASVEGNVMSLIYGDDFIGKEVIANRQFRSLFNGATNITSAEHLVLPSTTLTDYCYNNMFRNCTSLTTAPSILLATTLAQFCYNYMFYGCTSLTTSPELKATTLANSCYQNMFNGCTSLTTSPELKATTLANSCYEQMFRGCTSLTTAPSILPATTLASYCYQNMFNGCTNLTVAPELQATTLANNCYTRMFYGCASLTTAPELPATTLANNCYSQMFQGCTSLTVAPELPATTLARYCYLYMFDGCTSLTTAPELPATTLALECYREMFNGCTSLNSITCLATDISATSCTNNWVVSVASSGTFTKASSMTSWPSGANGIPNGWNVQDAT